tara:strand:+ start:794 stop:1243 length:450 start_codon:yes stop_codon:yes gene_type:complete
MKNLKDKLKNIIKEVILNEQTGPCPCPQWYTNMTGDGQSMACCGLDPNEDFPTAPQVDPPKSDGITRYPEGELQLSRRQNATWKILEFDTSNNIYGDNTTQLPNNYDIASCPNSGGSTNTIFLNPNKQKGKIIKTPIKVKQRRLFERKK